MKLAFRVDASLEIGTGHVFRCLALAQTLRALNPSCQCRFVCRALNSHLAEHISAQGFGVTLLSAPGAGSRVPISTDYTSWAEVAWERDALETHAALCDFVPDWLVLDHYSFDARWEARVARSSKLLVIDDLANRPHSAEILVDQNLGRMSADYASLTPNDCELLIGPSHALLRPEFPAARGRALASRQTRGLQHLLVSMGGIDRMGMSSRILGVLGRSNLSADARITVVMGGGAPGVDKVRKTARMLPWECEVVVGSSNMSVQMIEADLAIGAVGSTTWERCCLGLPALLVVVAENQRTAANALASSGAAILLGDAEDSSLELRLLEHMNILSVPQNLFDLSKAAAALCDGEGALRLGQRLLRKRK